MEGYDGSVTINTQLDNKELLKQVNDVKRILDDLVNRVKSIGAVATQKLVPSGSATQGITQMTEAYQRQEQVVLQLQADIERLSQTQEQTAEYKDLQAQIDKAEKKLVSYEDKIDKMAALYGRQGLEGRKAFQSVTYDMERLQEQYEKLLARQQEMQAAGTAFVPADTTALQERLIRAQEKQDAILARMIPKYQQLRSEVRQTGNEAVAAHQKAAKHTGINFNKIVKYTLGVRSLFVLYRRMRQAAAEALKTVAQGDPTFNAAMSELLTSWNQFKADLGTLLQPIVQSLIPTLTYILNKLHAALLKVAEVLAALSGQDYIDVVTVKTANYAGALDGVAKSAAAAKKALGGYDKLNVISGGDAYGFSAVADSLKDVDKEIPKVERHATNLGEIGKTIVGTVEEAYGVLYEYQQAFEEEGIGGVADKFIDNLAYVLENQEWISWEKPKWMKWVEEHVDDGRATKREWTDEDEAEWQAKKIAEQFEKTIEKNLRDVRVAEWIASGGKDELKKLGKDLKAFAKKTAKTMHDEYVNNGGTDLSEQFKESVKNGLDEVANLGRGAKRTILAVFGFTDAEIDEMVGDVEDAVEHVSKGADESAARLGRSARDEVIKGWMYTDGQKKDIETRTAALADYNIQEQTAAGNLGKSMASAVSAAYNFSATDTNNATEKTKKLLSGTASVKTEAERVGKELGGKLSSTLRESISFSEQDGKNAANELAKGMNAVSAQANQNGSVLNMALQGVGKKIAEGINKGTISVPVTFTGQATPVSAQANYNNQKINTTVKVYLDKKVIASAVFEEAAQLQKQVGDGIASAIQYAVSMG